MTVLMQHTRRDDDDDDDDAASNRRARVSCVALNQPNERSMRVLGIPVRLQRAHTMMIPTDMLSLVLPSTK